MLLLASFAFREHNRSCEPTLQMDSLKMIRTRLQRANQTVGKPLPSASQRSTASSQEKASEACTPYSSLLRVAALGHDTAVPDFNIHVCTLDITLHMLLLPQLHTTELLS